MALKNKKKKSKRQPVIYIVSWQGTDSAGGMERVVGIIERIVAEKYKVVILDKAFLKQDKFLKHMFKTEHPVWLMFLSSICAKKNLKKEDILIGNGFNAPFVRKDISIAHGCMYTYKKAIGLAAWSGSTPFEKISLQNSRKILSVSREVQDSIIKFYKIKKEKIRVVNNTVNTDIFFPIHRENVGEKITILFCGRLEDGKGIDVLQQLIESIQNEKNVAINIATPTSENAEIFTQWESVSVNIGLSLADMNDFYNSGHVLFVPSKSEGFEMVTLEALAAGIPVVGNRVGAIKELAYQKFDGVYPLDDLHDIEFVKRKIFETALSYNQNVIKRNELHERVKERFGLEQYAQTIMEEVGKAVDDKCKG